MRPWALKEVTKKEHMWTDILWSIDCITASIKDHNISTTCAGPMWLSLEHLRELFVTLAACSWLLALDVLRTFAYQQCRLVLCNSHIVCERPMDVRCTGLGGVPKKDWDGIVHGGFPLCHDSGPDGASNRSRRVTHGSHQSNVSKFCSSFAFAFAHSSKTRLWQNQNVDKQRLRIFDLLKYLYL